MSGDIFLEPPHPGLGEETQVCAVLHNRSERSVRCEVALGRSPQLSTSPVYEDFFSQAVEVPPLDIQRVCSNPFPWEGAKSFRATIRQEGYQDHIVYRNAVSIQGPREETCLLIGQEIFSPETGLATITVGPIRFNAAGSSDVLIPINAVDCTSDGEIDIEVPFSDPLSGTMANFEFLDDACGGTDPIEATVFLRNGGGGGVPYALDSQGQPVGDVLIQPGPEIQFPVLSSSSGIHQVGIEGSEICIQGLCWRCESQNEYIVPLEVRNPQGGSQDVFLRSSVVGLPGWQADMPDHIQVPGGDSAVVQVHLVPPDGGMVYAGDQSYLELNTLTQEGEVLGGARIEVLH